MDTTEMIQKLVAEGYLVEKVVPALPGIPDRDLYRPFVNNWSTFSPWVQDPVIEGIIEQLLANQRITLVSRDRCWILMNLARQALNHEGEFWEAGVYQGGTALLLNKVIKEGNSERKLRLFDTFEGMPQPDARIDKHRAGDFADTHIESVKDIVGRDSYIDFRKGFLPDTFKGLEDAVIAMVHVDLDIYPSIIDACEFIYGRMVTGGVMVFDDYGFHSCPGARKAVDEFFADKPEVPLSLPTSQCLVFKL